jgi:hypothetical protein
MPALPSVVRTARCCLSSWFCCEVESKPAPLNGTRVRHPADWFVEACRYASVRAAAPWLCHDFCRRALTRFVGFVKRNSEERKNAVVVALVVLQV